MQTLREKFSTHTEDKKKKSCFHWRVLRFSVLFLISVLLILLAYEFKSDPEDENEGGGHGKARFTANSTLLDGNNSRKAVFDINDIITHDKWLVLQPVEGNSLSEEQRKTLACAVIEASFDQGWRPLVLAEESACCSKPRCVLLHSEKRARLPYDTRKYLESLDATDKKNIHLQRNLAYLFAIQHGARFVMDWYLEDHDAAIIGDYPNKALQLLQSSTLDISLGLVMKSLSETPLFAVSPRPTRRLFNPHSHFGQPNLWPVGYQPPIQRNLMHNLRKQPHLPWVTDTQYSRVRNYSKIETFTKQRYRVCEIRPPSIEQFLNQPEERSLDVAAPPVTLPSDTLSLASSKITIYSGDALWALALLPNSVENIPYQMTRTLWNYPLVANIAAGIKVSLSPLAAAGVPYPPASEATKAASAELTNAVMRWRCNSRSILSCIVLLSHELGPKFSTNSSGLLSNWANDLKRLRYLEPPVVPLRRGGMLTPCLGHHGLGGVTFQPAAHEQPNTSPAKRRERQRQMDQHYEPHFKLLEWMSRLNSSHHSSKSGSTEEVAAEEKPVVVEQIELVPLNDAKEDTVNGLQKEIVEEMCRGFSSMLPIVPKNHFDKTLLVVAFDNDEVYEQLPMIDVIYRTHFRNILYCGYPHASLNTYLHKLQLENRTISYLPASTPGYECLVGAMEMEYHVEGYLLASAHSLLLPESLTDLDRNEFWYGSDENDVLISKSTWRQVDPGGKKVPRIMNSVVQALRFVAHLVGVHEDEQHHSHDGEPGEDDHVHSSEEVPQSQANKIAAEAPPAEEAASFELHLHAERVSPLTNLTDVYATFDAATEEPSKIGTATAELHESDANKTVIDFVSIDHEERLPTENSSYTSKAEEAEPVIVEYDATSPVFAEPPISETPQSELELNVSEPHEAHPEYLDVKTPQIYNLSLPEGPGDTLINPVEDEKDLESSNNYAKRTTELHANRTRRKAPVDPQVVLQENHVVDSAFGHIAELIGLVLSKLQSEPEATPSLPFQLYQQNSMRLDPREFKHLRCGGDHVPSFYANKELCSSLRLFFANIDRLYRTEGGFLPSYNHYPVYYVPVGQQKAFYLLANVFLQFGVPEQVAVPLVLHGLANGRVHRLKRTFFGSDTPAVVEPSYPLFDESANYLFPVYLQRDLHGDKKLQVIFCLKYLYSILS